MFFIKNLLVFFGGKSPERDISVITGLLTLNSIDKSLFNAIPIYIDGKGIFYTGEKLKRIDFYKQFNEKEVFKVNFLFGERAFSYKKGKKEVVGKITRQDLRTIAETKLPDLNAYSVEEAEKIIEGTAVNMGIEISE